MKIHTNELKMSKIKNCDKQILQAVTNSIDLMPIDLIKIIIEYLEHQINCTLVGESSLLFESLATIATDGKKLYVADFKTSSIKVLNESCELLFEWGNYGSGIGEFKFEGSNNLVIYDARVYIAERFNNRIQIFDLNGNFIEKITLFCECKGMCIIESQIYVSLSPDWSISVFTLHGKFVRKFKIGSYFAPYYSMSCDNNIYLHCYPYGEIICVSNKGKELFSINYSELKLSPFHLYSAYCYGTSIYVTDGYKICQFNKNALIIKTWTISQERLAKFTKFACPPTPAGVVVLNGKCFVINRFKKNIAIFE